MISSGKHLNDASQYEIYEVRRKCGKETRTFPVGEDEKQGIAQGLQCQREGFDEAIMDSTKMFE